jgi:hypothetical protein
VVIDLNAIGAVSFYAMIDPDKNGICKAARVRVDEVFFALQYRNSPSINGDSLTSNIERRSKWPLAARECCSEIRRKLTTNEVRPKRTRPVVPIVLEPGNAAARYLQRQVVEILNAPSELKVAEVAETIRTILGVAEPPVVGYRALRNMAARKGTFDAEMAKAALQDATVKFLSF